MDKCSGSIGGERELLKKLRAEFPSLSPSWDDGAVLPSIKTPVVTVDSFFQGTHFLKWWQLPQVLGRRLLEATLSDLAAMGAGPGRIFTALCIPPELKFDWLVDFYRGLLSRKDVAIAGGETISGDKFGVTLTAIGDCRSTVLTRNTLRDEDVLWVSGTIGRACGIIELFDKMGGCRGVDMIPVNDCLSSEELEQARAFLTPRAQFDIAEILIEKGVKCAIDISDGLFSEAEHLARESRIDCVIKIDDVPLFKSVEHIPLKAAASGEDFVLLFGAEKTLDFEDNGCTRVGYAKSGNGELTVVQNGKEIDIKEKGYNHLKG